VAWKFTDSPALPTRNGINLTFFRSGCTDFRRLICSHDKDVKKMRTKTTLALVILVGMTAVASAQQASGDRGVQRTAANTGGTAAAAAPATNGPTPGLPAVIGSIDMDSVFKNYEKVKLSSEEIQAKALAKQNELQKLVTDMKALAEKQSSLQPTSPEFKKIDQQLTQMKIQGEAAQQSAQKELAQLEAEALAGLYREIQSMTARVAAWRGMNYVVKVSNEPVTASDPQAVMAAMSRTVVYSDPRNDITQQVVQFLNQEYRKVAGTQARPAAATGNAAAPAAAAAQPATTRGN
jgi:outer membrane protein